MAGKGGSCNTPGNAKPRIGASGQKMGSATGGPKHGTMGQPKGQAGNKPRFGDVGQRGASSGRGKTATKPVVAD